MRVTTQDDHSRGPKYGGASATKLGSGITVPGSAGPETPDASDHGRSAKYFRLFVLLGLLYVTMPTFTNLIIAGRATPTPNHPLAAAPATTLGSFVSQSLTIIIACASVWVTLQLLPTSRPPASSALSLTALFLTIAVIPLISATEGGTPRAVLNLLLFAVPISLLRLKPDGFRVIADAGVALAAFSLAFAVLSNRAWMLPTADDLAGTKAFFGTKLLAGPMAQGNQLGISLAAALPFILELYRGRRRFVGVLLVFTTIVLAAARTSLIAAAVVLLSWFFLRRMRPSLRVFSALILMILLASIDFALPWFERNPQAFTQRGEIWIVSIQYWKHAPVTGYGPRAYAPGTSLTDALGSAHYHGHNIFVTAATTGGLVLVLTLGLVLAIVGLRTNTTGARTLIGPLFVVAILAVGLAETPLRTDGFGDQAWVTWLGLIGLVSLRRDVAAPWPLGAVPLSLRARERSEP